MNAVESRLFGEFKQLDKLCKDIYGEGDGSGKLGVTLYLDEMDASYQEGAQKVQGWVSDYKQLKHIRNERNILAHETGATSLTEADIAFTKAFKSRILNQTDPLSLLRKAKKASPPRRKQSQTAYGNGGKNAKAKKGDNGCATAFLAALGIAAVLLILAYVYFNI